MRGNRRGAMDAEIDGRSNGSAELHSAVSRTCSPLDVRPSSSAKTCRTASRVQLGDTAECNSALEFGSVRCIEDCAGEVRGEFFGLRVRGEPRREVR